MIQAIISRLSKNSFLLKGWSVTLVSALLALATVNLHKEFIYLAYFPGLAFWLLDGFYLRQERLFRRLYERVRLLDDSQIDFSMNTQLVENEVCSWWELVRSRTLAIFYGSEMLAIIIVMLFTLAKD